MATKPYTREILINGESIKVDVGVDVTPRRCSSNYNILAEKMKPGDSILLDNYGKCAQLAKWIKKLGFEAPIRNIDGKKHRVWKIDPNKPV